VLEESLQVLHGDGGLGGRGVLDLFALGHGLLTNGPDAELEVLERGDVLFEGLVLGANNFVQIIFLVVGQVWIFDGTDLTLHN